jgi:hypothetical protein
LLGPSLVAVVGVVVFKVVFEVVVGLAVFGWHFAEVRFGSAFKNFRFALLAPLGFLGYFFKEAASGDLDMVSIRVRDDGTGTAPIVEKGREQPFKQGEFFVFEVKDEVAKYWNKLPPARRDELFKQSKKERKDLRQILDAFVFKPAHTK